MELELVLQQQCSEVVLWKLCVSKEEHELIDLPSEGASVSILSPLILSLISLISLTSWRANWARWLFVTILLFFSKSMRAWTLTSKHVRCIVKISGVFSSSSNNYKRSVSTCTTRRPLGTYLMSCGKELIGALVVFRFGCMEPARN